MGFNGIFRIAPQMFDADILLNPLKKNFYIPAMTIDITNFNSREDKVVGYKSNYQDLRLLLFLYHLDITF